MSVLIRNLALINYLNTETLWRMKLCGNDANENMFLISVDRSQITATSLSFM